MRIRLTCVVSTALELGGNVAFDIIIWRMFISLFCQMFVQMWRCRLYMYVVRFLK